MTEQNEAFLKVLRSALRGEEYPQSEETQLLRIAGVNGVLPLVANALFPNGAARNDSIKRAREITIRQAQHTADFLLLMQRLELEGLRPVIVKGIVCRSLYPESELRHSADEDLLIAPEEYARYASVLEAEGYAPIIGLPKQADDYETSFCNKESQLTVELHTSLFPASSEAYGDCSTFFESALERAVETVIDGVKIPTLLPTDHLLYLICHAYKHLLHSGISIRQVCDIALMSEKHRSEIDWRYIRSSCDSLHISTLCAALFRICEVHLGFFMPEVFTDIETDEGLLLDDILRGGRFSEAHIDRAHSSTMTLEAVSAARSGRKRKGALHSVFLPLDAMRGHFPYLRRYPWLLPVAWAQRICRYLARKSHPDPVSPARSLQIARERIALLAEYKLIDQL